MTLEDVDIPEVLTDLFEPMPEFWLDVSSTELRAAAAAAGGEASYRLLEFPCTRESVRKQQTRAFLIKASGSLPTRAKTAQTPHDYSSVRGSAQRDEVLAL